jgi:Restriction endonuclease
MRSLTTKELGDVFELKVIDILDSKGINSYGYRTKYLIYDNNNQFEKYRHTGDGGIDVVGYYKTKRINIQCKYKTNGKVSPSEIRDFLGAISNDQDVIGIFVTNNGYSIKSKNTAESNKRKIHLTTINQDDDNYIGKLLDEIINHEEMKIQETNQDKSLSNVEIETSENTDVKIISDSVLTRGICKIKVNFK